jgi:hypothetical protein
VTIEQVVMLSERNDEHDQRDSLLREQKDVEKRMECLLAAIETAGDIASLTTKLRELEVRQTQLRRNCRRCDH